MHNLQETILRLAVDAKVALRNKPGEVLEVHVGPQDGDCEAYVVGYVVGTVTVDDFIDDWGYGLVGRRWNEADEPATVREIERETQHVNRCCGRYLGVVHEDGALLVEV